MNRADQLGALLTKGVDLAEAGLALGVGLLNSFSAVQERVVERMVKGDNGQPIPQEGGPGNGAPGPSGETSVPNANESCIVNRLHIASGDPVYVPFSINNDSDTAPKTIKLVASGFVGEVTGIKLPPDALCISPDVSTIAPMDFNKFIVNGVLSTDTPPDTYAGWIVVSGEDTFQIPIRLIVGAPRGKSD
ncbi:MAG: hypothetical protein GY847_34500 [Proteobacteria bacterium]|nr:hypothetical protein [Pseudomonadota bacterium]